MTEQSLTGRVAIVTGASRRKGIGAAIARRLAAAGADLVLQVWVPHDAEHAWGADSNGPNALADELRALGRRVELVSADFLDPRAPSTVVGHAVEKFGHVDILVANHARSTPWGPLAEITAEEIDAAYAINTRATLLLIRDFAAQYDDNRESGRIVLFTSGQNSGVMPEEIPYASSKAALAGMTPSLAAAVAKRRITVNCVNPGPTDTGWASPDITEGALQRLHFGRWGEPDDAARLVLWLVGPDGRWVTGQVINSDGGFCLA